MRLFELQRVVRGQGPDGRRALNFTSSSPKCSQIIYDVDGQPGSITVTGGSGSMDYFKTNRSERHQLSIGSCSICRGGGEQQCHTADLGSCMQSSMAVLESDPERGRANKGDIEAAVRTLRRAGASFEACLAASNIKKIPSPEDSARAAFITCD